MFDIEYYNRYNQRIFTSGNAVSEGSPVTGAVSDLLYANLPPNLILVSSASGKIVASSGDASKVANLNDTTGPIGAALAGKEPTLAKGNLTEVTSSVLTITGGTGAVIGSGASIQVKQATGAQAGYLSASDWNAFNSKLGTSLPNGNIWIGDGGGLAQPRSISGDVSITNLGVVTIGPGAIDDSKISGSAAIQFSKMENLTNNRALVSSGSGDVSVSAVTSTELGLLSGLTGGSIQSQLAGKLSATITTPALGDILYYNGTTWVNFPRGASGQILSSTATTIQWINSSSNVPAGGGINNVLRKVSAADYDTGWVALTASMITDITASAAQINALSTGYYDAVSSVQTQINSKLSKVLLQNYMFVGSSLGEVTTIAPGTNGYVLTSVGGVPTWVSPGTGGTVTSVAASGGTTGMSFGGSPITVSGTLTLTGTLVAANGGTGQSAYTVGDILYASTTSALSKLSAGTSGYVLTSNGPGVAPSWQVATGGGGGGGGDVVGPASSVNNNVVFFNGTTGKLIKDSGLTLSGTNTGDQTITLTGDVTGSGTGSFAATIANAAVTYAKFQDLSGLAVFGKGSLGAGAGTSIVAGIDGAVLRRSGTTVDFGTIATAGITDAAVTLAKMADVATSTVFYRKTAGTGVPEVQTLATLKTDLGLTGTNSGDQTITLTGDVTGSGTGSFAATIANSAVTNAKMANMAASTIKGNNTGGAAAPIDLTTTQVKTLLAIANTDVSGLGTMSTQNATSVAITGGSITGLTTFAIRNAGTGAFDMTIAHNGTLTAGRTLTWNLNDAARTISLSGNLTVSSAATISGTNTGDQTITLTSDVTGSGTGSFATTIANGAVTNAKMANMAANSIKGNNTGSPAVAADLTTTQVKTLLAIANTDVSGLGTMSTQNAASVAITGGTIAGLTGLAIRNAGTGAFDMTIAYNGTLTAGRSLTWNLNDVARTISMSGNLTVSGAATISGTNTGDQTITLTSDVTGSGTGSFATTIAANAVTLAKFQQVATASILGRVTAATGNVEVLTGTQATTLLDLFSTSTTTKGLVPGSNGASALFLRGDGQWAAPAGSGDMVLASAQTVTGKKTFTQDATNAAIRIWVTSGGEPSSAVNGDLWWNSSWNAIQTMFASASYFLQAGNLTATRIPVSQTAGILIDYSTLSYDGSYLIVNAVKLSSPATGAMTDQLVVRNTTAGEIKSISLTGTPSASTFLRGDGSWATPSGGGYTVVTVTAATHNETATSGQKIILCDTTSNGITVNLPTASGNTAMIVVKRISGGSNSLTVDGSGTETIDGGLTASLVEQDESVTLISDGTNWRII